MRWWAKIVGATASAHAGKQAKRAASTARNTTWSVMMLSPAGLTLGAERLCNPEYDAPGERSQQRADTADATTGLESRR